MVQQHLDDKLLFSAKEAGKIIFGVWNNTTRKKTYRLLHAGTVQAMRLGKTWLIPQSELEKFQTVNAKQKKENVDAQGLSIGN